MKIDLQKHDLFFQNRSYRDPSNTLLQFDNNLILREFHTNNDFYLNSLSHPRIQSLMANKLLIESQVYKKNSSIIEHRHIKFMNYPYEWSSYFFKKAALRYLDILDLLVEDGFSLKDGHAYNLTFEGCNPIYFDYGSIENLQDSQMWFGFTQFIEHFVYYLILSNAIRIPTHVLYKSFPNGITPQTMAQLLPLRKKFSFVYFQYVFLLDNLNSTSKAKYYNNTNLFNLKDIQKIIKSNIYRIKKIILNLDTYQPKSSLWINYDQKCLYSNIELNRKIDFISHVLSKSYQQALDIGSNTGIFSFHLLKFCKSIIAVDSDHCSIEELSKRIDHSHNITPLIIDLCSPSPGQGWNNKERLSFLERVNPDLIVCLAIIHHIIFNNGIKIEFFVNLLTQFRADIILEFINLEDPIVQKYVQNNSNQQINYSKEAIINLMSKTHNLKEQIEINSTRCLMFFQLKD